jgi:hypothetical protein
MKKIISYVLLLSLTLTIVVSAMTGRQSVSTLLVDQQMTQIVGGKNAACGETVACGGGAGGGGSIWACVGAALIGGVGIAGAVISMGTSSVIAIYGLSLVATGICAH